MTTAAPMTDTIADRLADLRDSADMIRTTDWSKTDVDTLGEDIADAITDIAFLLEKIAEAAGVTK